MSSFDSDIVVWGVRLYDAFNRASSANGSANVLDVTRALDDLNVKLKPYNAVAFDNIELSVDEIRDQRSNTENTASGLYEQTKMSFDIFKIKAATKLLPELINVANVRYSIVVKKENAADLAQAILLSEPLKNMISVVNNTFDQTINPKYKKDVLEPKLEERLLG